MPSHGKTGWFAGGAIVPGLALIETLPLVWHLLLMSVSWQFDRAPAMGADATAAATKPPTNKAALVLRPFIPASPTRPASAATAGSTDPREHRNVGGRRESAGTGRDRHAAVGLADALEIRLLAGRTGTGDRS